MKRLILFAAFTLTAAPVPAQQPPSTTGAQPATMTVVLLSNGMVVATPDVPPPGDAQVKSSLTISPSTMVVVTDGTLVPVPATTPAAAAAAQASDQPSAPTKVETHTDGSTTETIMDSNGNPIVMVRRKAGSPPPPPK